MTELPKPSRTALEAAQRYPRIGLLIGAKWIYDRPRTSTVINPSDESVLGTIPHATSDDIAQALVAAAAGFERWRVVPPAERAAFLRRTAALMRERIEEMADVITLEQGKRWADSHREVLRAVSFLEWDAEQLLRNYGRLVPSTSPIQQLVVREPIGPIAAFTPWNVPLSAAGRKISGALAAGCSIIIKPASETPAITCLFVQCLLDAGLPPGVVNVLSGNAADISKQLITSPVIRAVTLTGSTLVGKTLMKLAAEGLKPTLMELGGHAPVLIDRDVSPAAVARLSVQASFRMAGQLCVSPSRFLVHRDIYSEFVECFAEGASDFRVGDGFSRGVEMGPVITERRVEFMEHLVADAVACGGRVAVGGKRLGNTGFFYAPTVLADVPLEAAIMREEPFGPLAACTPVDDMEQALAIANNLDVGLAGYFFTNSIEKGHHLSAELQCGSVAWNNFNTPACDAPFGGYKESGVGSEGGAESLDFYTISKTIIQNMVAL